MYSVEVSPAAEQAIEDVGRYLESFTDPSDIKKVEDRIESIINSLDQMPTRHRRYLPPLLTHPDLRCADAGKYTVFFDVNERAQLVTVLDVQHRRRNPRVVRRRLTKI